VRLAERRRRLRREGGAETGHVAVEALVLPGLEGEVAVRVEHESPDVVNGDSAA
jgi:hypothetical protein